MCCAVLGFPAASAVKNPPAIQEMQIQSVGQEDSLEKEMSTNSTSSILAWEIPWTEGPGGLQSMESQRVRHDLETQEQQLQKCYIKGAFLVSTRQKSSCLQVNTHFDPDMEAVGKWQIKERH